MPDMQKYMDHLTHLLDVSCPFPLDVEIGGEEWVINISPRSVELPARVKKLIGVKCQEGSILISIARAAFADCGASTAERYFGSSFREKGSYMMLRVEEPLGPRDIAPLVARWLNAYVASVGSGRP